MKTKKAMYDQRSKHDLYIYINIDESSPDIRNKPNEICLLIVIRKKKKKKKKKKKHFILQTKLVF